MKKLVDDAFNPPHVVGHYFTKRGALNAARRLEAYLRAHPSEAKGLPRARHRVV